MDGKDKRNVGRSEKNPKMRQARRMMALFSRERLNDCAEMETRHRVHTKPTKEEV